MCVTKSSSGTFESGKETKEMSHTMHLSWLVAMEMSCHLSSNRRESYIQRTGGQTNPFITDIQSGSRIAIEECESSLRRKYWKYPSIHLSTKATILLSVPRQLLLYVQVMNFSLLKNYQSYRMIAFWFPYFVCRRVKERRSNLFCSSHTKKHSIFIKISWSLFSFSPRSFHILIPDEVFV